MVLRLAGALDVPLREQNQLLLAAGLAPVYTERSLDDPDMAVVRTSVSRVLSAYDPYPCLVVNRNWDVLQANSGTATLLDGITPRLLDKPNALRIALHPDGLAPRIRNLGQWRHHLVSRLRREAAASGSPALGSLLAEVESYPSAPADSADLGVAGPRVFDLQIALTAQDNGASQIWTHDSQFIRVPGLRIVFPLHGGVPS